MFEHEWPFSFSVCIPSCFFSEWRLRRRLQKWYMLHFVSICILQYWISTYLTFSTRICTCINLFQIYSEECSNKGGTQDGSCANGYGVCCICKWLQWNFCYSVQPCNALLLCIWLLVTLRCGGSSSENCTYFESSGTAATGACRAQICPCSNNICQVSN